MPRSGCAGRRLEEPQRRLEGWLATAKPWLSLLAGGRLQRHVSTSLALTLLLQAR